MMTRNARSLWAALTGDPVPATWAGQVRETAVAAILMAANRQDQSGARELGVTPDELDWLARAVVRCEVSDHELASRTKAGWWSGAGQEGGGGSSTRGSL